MRDSIAHDTFGVRLGRLGLLDKRHAATTREQEPIGGWIEHG